MIESGEAQHLQRRMSRMASVVAYDAPHLAHAADPEKVLNPPWADTLAQPTLNGVLRILAARGFGHRANVEETHRLCFAIDFYRAQQQRVQLRVVVLQFRE